MFSVSLIDNYIGRSCLTSQLVGWILAYGSSPEEWLNLIASPGRDLQDSLYMAGSGLDHISCCPAATRKEESFANRINVQYDFFYRSCLH